MPPNTPDLPVPPARPFYGPVVVRAAFVLAVLGWGIGFYGPPVFLHAVVTRTGWPLTLVSSAVSFHFLLGAAVVACLPRLHARLGLPATTLSGACALALGTLGWAVAAQPWQLFAAAALSGGGWVTMGAAAINAMVSPWYASGRPVALSRAYNGASIGGVVFSPLWVALIAQLGFAWTAGLIGLGMLGVVAALALGVLAQTPKRLGQLPDGAAPGTPAPTHAHAAAALPGRQLWRNRQFQTLAGAMALGLFAQIGLIAHLYSLLTPALGTQAAGWAMALATACAIGGRWLAAARMRPETDRRLLACASYGVQVLGSLVLWLAGTHHPAWAVLGVVLFGAGIGNATSLPPLVAQTEFAQSDLPRAVALMVAMAQALYAFAPAAFALLLAYPASAGAGLGTPAYFAGAVLVQLATMACLLAGRKSS